MIPLNPVSSNVATFNWSPSDGLDTPTIENPSASPEQTTTYLVTVTSPDGCTASDEITISVNLEIEINNFMSPNGDGDNDTWKIQGNYLLNECSVSIFDSWGNTLYESIGYENDWDGTFKGEQLPQGNYYYVIECDGQRFTGSITLIR